jgi:hypothetical protein
LGSEAAAGVVTAEVADFFDDDEIEAAGAARMIEKGTGVDAARLLVECVEWRRSSLGAFIPRRARGATVLDRDIILPEERPVALGRGET